MDCRRKYGDFFKKKSQKRSRGHRDSNPRQAVKLLRILSATTPVASTPLTNNREKIDQKETRIRKNIFIGRSWVVHSIYISYFVFKALHGLRQMSLHSFAFFFVASSDGKLQGSEAAEHYRFFHRFFYSSRSPPWSPWATLRVLRAFCFSQEIAPVFPKKVVLVSLDRVNLANA